MSRQVFQNSVLREWWNDATRTYTTYNASGAQTSTRPYTAAEDAEADADAAVATAVTNEEQIVAALNTALGGLQTLIDTSNATIKADPQIYIKDLARTLRRVIRLQLKKFDGSA